MTGRPTTAAGPHRYTVVGSKVVFSGRVISVRVDQVEMPGGLVAQRDIVVHPGAVGVAVVDADDRILLIRQYRHSVADVIWEVPAGIRDVDCEALVVTAQRELIEEAGLRAHEWYVLCDVLSSPGMSDETYRVFLARGPVAVPDDERPALHDEEVDLDPTWVDLDEALRWVDDGTIRNAMCVIAVIGADRARRSGYTTLRRA
ncbi:MAG TPA: NUDIX hydrolase [Mycobacteriales bacterium]|nr:NUDIX hydrolase [Mycobacteriales bacterium]